MAGVALALGSKGIFSFLFNSSRWSAVKGLLDRSFRPTPLLEEVARVYEWIEEKEALLLRLELAQDLVAVHPPGYARTLVDEMGEAYFFLVNSNANFGAELELRSIGNTETPLTLTDDLSGLKIPVARTEGGGWSAKVQLEPGAFVLLKAADLFLKERGRPDLYEDSLDSLFSQFKTSAKAILEPVAGGFDWKRVGRVYREDRIEERSPQ